MVQAGSLVCAVGPPVSTGPGHDSLEDTAVAFYRNPHKDSDLGIKTM